MKYAFLKLLFQWLEDLIKYRPLKTGFLVSKYCIFAFFFTFVKRYIFYAVYAELISENENQHRDKSNNLPNVLSFVTRYLVRRGDLRPCH